MKRKILLSLSLGIFALAGGIGLCFAVQPQAGSNALTEAQIAQARADGFDAHVTAQMRAEFINRLMRGVSTSDLKALEECVCWDGVEQPMRERMSASLQDVLEGSKGFPLHLSFVKRVDVGQMALVVDGRPQSQNLSWITNISFRLDGRMAPASAGHTMPVGIRDGRLFIICLVPTPVA